ncbi:MAG: aminotransferase class V-fold PLP-dependent enzyme [Gammaproteobacteria bacterium]|nr:aminotransferase class V-fold PLP-dependent enzyme [Gammaproteobacteria bacterium]
MQDSDKHSGLEMTPQQMRQLASKAADILIDRIGSMDSAKAWDGEFREILAREFDGPPPENGRAAEEVLEQIARDVLPYGAQLDHPRFFGFVPSSPTWPGIIADFLASGFNINTCSWLVSSGTSHLELVVIDWIRNWIGYPDSAGGLLTSGGSAASVEAIVAAREAAGHPAQPVVYMSNQSHSALIRAALIAGVRREHIRLIDTDDRFQMDINALRQQVSEDKTNGLQVVAVCANAGTTSTGAIDPLDVLADYCENEDVWLHVDAAYGGFALLTADGKEKLAGINRADSIGIDAHKWFFQPFEAGALIAKNGQTLENAFAIRHDALQDTIWGANHPNFSDRGLQLSRSPRALKIWMSVQIFGIAPFRSAIQRGLDLAKDAAKYIESTPVLELITPVSLGVVCFRVNDGSQDEQSLEEINRKVLAHVFWDELAFVSSTNLKGKFSLRLCILNHTTTWEDVQRTLDLVIRIGSNTLEPT